MVYILRASLIAVCAIFTLVFAQPRRPTFDYFEGVKMPRIAVVGSGMGGSVAAYTLQKLFGSSLPTIDVFEKNKVGGRAAELTVGGRVYEVGATMIHPRNQLLNDFQSTLGLSRVTADGGWALFDGQMNVFSPSENKYLRSFQMLWRYGLSAFTLDSHIKRFMADFERIYKWQKELQSFTTVPNLLFSMSDEVMNATHTSLRDHMTEAGISNQLLDELITVACRNNYGQTADKLNGFVGDVSVAGAEDGLWSVKGGNSGIPKGLLKLANANLLHNEVIRITNISSNATSSLFRVTTRTGEEREYDIIIVAHPFIDGQNMEQFVGFGEDFRSLSRPYHRTLAHIIKGVPNHSHFGYASVSDMPRNIFPIGKNDFYNGLSLLRPVDGSDPSDVYKVFANHKLTEEELSTLFSSREEVHVVDWLAYPEYNTQMVYPSFKIAEKVYYVNPIELAASAMETAAVSGTNVAYLALHEWMGHDHLIDNMFVIEEKHIKIEL